MANDGKSDNEVSKRIQAWWDNWREVTGIVCQESAGWSAGTYPKSICKTSNGVETVPMKNSTMKKMNVAEMRILRCEKGLTRRDKM